MSLLKVKLYADIQPISLSTPEGGPASESMLLPPHHDGLSKDDIDGVEKFVFFVGYARSGSSIIGSMLDAHPNMIIANECKEFGTWLKTPKLKLNKSYLFSAIYSDSRKSATTGGRSSDRKNRKGYSLFISSSWQGRFRKLKVIGNKQASGNTIVYLTDPSLFLDKCEELAETLRIPIYMIHVVRNPFDMIATRLHYVAGMGTPHKLLTSNSFTPAQHYNMEIMTSKIDRMFNLSEAVMNISRMCKAKVLHVHVEDLIKRPNSTLQSLCDALDLECSADYVQQCYNKTFKSVSRTRDLLVWSPSVRTTVEKRMKEFPFFRGYSFEGSFWEDR